MDDPEKPGTDGPLVLTLDGDSAPRLVVVLHLPRSGAVTRQVRGDEAGAGGALAARPKTMRPHHDRHARSADRPAGRR